jgi:biopolymer transport protein ExbB
VEALGREGFELPAPTDDLTEQAELIRRIFERAAGLMRRNGAVRTSRGPFFLTDGTQVQGTLIHVGRVASYGIGDSAVGALAPAGAGRLKLWPLDAADTALALRDERMPASLQIFLYESLEKAVQQKEEKTALSVIQSGGVIAWVIVILGAAALMLILARVFILWRVGSGTGRLVARLLPLIAKNKRDEAEKICESSRTAAGRVLHTTVCGLDRDREQIEDMVSESILHEAPTLERFGSTILVFAAVAPLLGLLGTVTGIISTFDVITEFGTGDPKLLSAGISEALVTTELGLMVAIPTLLLGTLLSGRAQSILTGLERSALTVVNLAKSTHVQEKAPVAGEDRKTVAAVTASMVEAGDGKVNRAETLGGVA